MSTPAGTDTGADLVDLAALARWMDDRDLPGGPITGATVLPGGTQNLLLRFERGGRSYVLRRGPRHLRRSSNEVMRREARVLRALAGTDVPHPAFVAGPGEPDEGVTDAVFYLMAPVDGVNPTVELPAAVADDPDGRRRFGLSVADAAARLGAVDHVAVGLADFGRPEGFLERQVPRWMAELEGYGELPGYPGPDIPGLDEVASWLEANRPTSWRPGIMHGDFHVANVLVAPDRPEVAAIVDWEMCTIGDPLLDLGWLVAMWPMGNAQVPGLASPREIVACYAALSDRDLSAIDWYAVMACFKLGIVLEGTHARAFAGKAPKDIGDLLHATTLDLFARAGHIMRNSLE